MDEVITNDAAPRPGRGRALAIGLAVLVVVLAVAVGSMVSEPGGEQPPGTSSANPTAILDGALASGTPAYVLIHSLTCVSCIEIAAVAAKVMPDYEGTVVFVDTITSDPAARGVLDRYPGQYIPTSVFVGADGAVVDTHIGPLTEAEMRERLDALAATAE